MIGTTIEYTKKGEENIHEMMLRLTSIDISCCPQCGEGKLAYLGPIVSSAYDNTS